MKKLLIGLTVLALFAMVASPALAWGGGRRSSSDVTVNIENDDTEVNNKVVVKADTGDNSVSGGGSIYTGDAFAGAMVYVDTNYSNVSIKAPCVGCRGDVDVDIENDDTEVNNKVIVKADTGDNEVSGRSRRCGGGSGTIATGGASAYAEVVVMTNSTIVRIRR